TDKLPPSIVSSLGKLKGQKYETEAAFLGDVRKVLSDEKGEETKRYGSVIGFRAQERDATAIRLEAKDDRLTGSLPNVKEPGIYSFELKPIKGAETDMLAFAYNVDAATESNLSR